MFTMHQPGLGKDPELNNDPYLKRPMRAAGSTSIVAVGLAQGHRVVFAAPAETLTYFGLSGVDFLDVDVEIETEFRWPIREFPPVRITTRGDRLRVLSFGEFASDSEFANRVLEYLETGR
jgi:hypothetical protein